MMTRASVLFALALAAAPASAQHATPSEFITLGTTAGPIATPNRSQPANLLRWRDQAILIDAGDGTAEQLAKANVPLASIRTIFISHLHFDHTGGLFAILGMRYQVLVPGTLTIYGPPGTRRLVDGLIAAMQPASEAGRGYARDLRRPPEAGIRVEEIVDGARVAIGEATVIAARNSHYSFAEGSPEVARFQSLSFRFNLPDRSIVYTGDTGPSAAVERLAAGADLLVSEVIDPDAALADLVRQRPDLPPFALAIIGEHFREQHLTAEAAGRMAAAARVRRLVFTHIALGDADRARAQAAAAAQFHGPVTFANDLDRF
ncbi:MAG TPA: MBL fold metallo-hydrolase [Allosphingosinicella sp.]